MYEPIEILYAPEKTLKAQVWPVAGHIIRPLLLAGFAAAGNTLEQLRDEIEEWDADTCLWLAAETTQMRLLGAAITTATVDEQGSCLSVRGVSGDHCERWAAQMYHQMLALAAHRQCMTLSYCGDPALAHFFPSVQVK